MRVELLYEVFELYFISMSCSEPLHFKFIRRSAGLYPESENRQFQLHQRFPISFRPVMCTCNACAVLGGRSFHLNVHIRAGWYLEFSLL